MIIMVVQVIKLSNKPTIYSLIEEEFRLVFSYKEFGYSRCPFGYSEILDIQKLFIAKNKNLINYDI